MNSVMRMSTNRPCGTVPSLHRRSPGCEGLPESSITPNLANRRSPGCEGLSKIHDAFNRSRRRGTGRMMFCASVIRVALALLLFQTVSGVKRDEKLWIWNDEQSVAGWATVVSVLADGEPEEVIFDGKIPLPPVNVTGRQWKFTKQGSAPRPPTPEAERSENAHGNQFLMNVNGVGVPRMNLAMMKRGPRFPTTKMIWFG